MKTTEETTTAAPGVPEEVSRLLPAKKDRK